MKIGVDVDPLELDAEPVIIAAHDLALDPERQPGGSTGQHDFHIAERVDGQPVIARADVRSLVDYP